MCAGASRGTLRAAGCNILAIANSAAILVPKERRFAADARSSGASGRSIAGKLHPFAHELRSFSGNGTAFPRMLAAMVRLGAASPASCARLHKSCAAFQKRSADSPCSCAAFPRKCTDFPEKFAAFRRMCAALFRIFATFMRIVPDFLTNFAISGQTFQYFTCFLGWRRAFAHGSAQIPNQDHWPGSDHWICWSSCGENRAWSGTDSRQTNSQRSRLLICGADAHFGGELVGSRTDAGLFFPKGEAVSGRRTVSGLLRCPPARRCCCRSGPLRGPFAGGFGRRDSTSGRCSCGRRRRGRRAGSRRRRG